MKAILYRRYGPPEVLEYAEAPEPQIKDRQILVRVHSASVNPVDWKFRSGKPRIPFLRLPRIPGLDIAGEVARVGKAVTRFKAGDAVYGMLPAFSGGGCAEQAALPERNAALKPRRLTFDEAAAVPVAGLTALQGLRDHGRIKNGDRVLINGASGGVGSFAVQLAKAFGAEVTAVTGASNREFVKDLGADRVVDYTEVDFTRIDRRFDIVFDAVANRSFGSCRRILAPKGIYLKTLPDASTLLGAVLSPLFGGKRAGLVNVRPRGADLEFLSDWFEAGKIRPAVTKIFPLSKTAEAHAHSETGHARGKIIVQIVQENQAKALGKGA